MKSDKESLSFGQYLQSIRLEKKISLEKISDETRIGLGTLKLIEKEEHENLPAEVFVKGFLRAYARAIGADGGEAVQRYESRLSVIHELSGTDKEFGTSTLRFWWKLLFVLVVYFALFAVSILGMSYLERHSSENEPFKQHTAAQEQQAAPTPAQGDIESDKSVVKARKICPTYNCQRRYMDEGYCRQSGSEGIQPCIRRWPGVGSLIEIQPSHRQCRRCYT
jgi:cytoskeletal protein RodZ